jgi:hypothetical protein
MLLNGGELDGVRVLSPASVRLITTNQIGDLRNWQLTRDLTGRCRTTCGWSPPPRPRWSTDLHPQWPYDLPRQ